jgi:haloacetate dehalogenase
MYENDSSGDHKALSIVGDHRRRVVGGAIAMTALGVTNKAHTQRSQTGATGRDLAGHYFPGFESRRVKTSGAIINVLVGGNGPPVLLLHGYPENLLAWRKIAPELSRTHTVVVPDMRGYGDSEKPDGGDAHVNYSKRAMALDQVEVMATLGFEKFAIVGHDRGARVAQRLAQDHPERVDRAMFLDIVPTDYMYQTADKAFGVAYWHWFFLIQPAPFPETLIQGSPDAFMSRMMKGLVPEVVSEDVCQDYLRCLKSPNAALAICEDYRAGAGIDLVHAMADSGRKIDLPVHVLWGAKGFIGTRYEPLAVWQNYATRLTGRALTCNHWLPEEAPDEILKETRWFLSEA